MSLLPLLRFARAVPRLRWAPRLVVTLALFVVGVGCGAGMQTPESVLEEQIDAFHQHLRWGRFADAAIFFSSDERDRFLDEFDDRGDDFQITDVDVRRVEMRDDPRGAVVTMRYQAFELPSTVVQTVRWRLRWEYDDALRAWRITDRERLPASGSRRDDPDEDDILDPSVR